MVSEIETKTKLWKGYIEKFLNEKSKDNPRKRKRPDIKKEDIQCALKNMKNGRAPEN